MRRLGSVGPSRSMGQLEKLLVIALGLGVVLLMQAAPLAGGRPQATGAGGRTAVTVTPAGAAAPAATAPGTTSAPEPASEAAPTPESASAAPRPDPPYFRIVAGGTGANLRSAPSTSAPIVQRLRDGAVVTNLDQQQTAEGLTWRRVAEGDVDGWIAAELLAPQRD